MADTNQELIAAIEDAAIGAIAFRIERAVMQALQLTLFSHGTVEQLTNSITNILIEERNEAVRDTVAACMVAIECDVPREVYSRLSGPVERQLITKSNDVFAKARDIADVQMKGFDEAVKRVQARLAKEDGQDED